MKAYLAYTRVSTVKQGEHGSSLQEQKSSIEAYAARHGLTITGWFEEMETAAKLGRRMFNRMVSELGKGRVAGVIIHKIDRSARNLKDWARLGELIDKGVEVHFAHESLDLASRGGRLSADIQAVVAADFIRNLRQEVRKGVYGRLKQGLYPFPAPVGYVDRGKGQVKEIDPLLGPLVRETFELYGTGRYSLDDLLLEMHARGLRNKAGGRVSRTGIAHLLHNPFYMGIVRLRRAGETFEGVHKPLITKAIYDRAQAVMSGRAYKGTARHDYIFRRQIRCGRCDRALVGERQKGHVYYRCHTPACRGTSLREADVETVIRDLLQLLAFTDDELRDLRDLGDEARVNVKAEIKARKAQLRLSLGRCEDRLTRLTDAYLDAALDRETFEHRKAALFADRRGLQDALEQPDGDGTTASLLKKLELGSTAYLRFDSPIAEEKRETVISVSSNLVAIGKELAIEPLFPFDEVLKQRISNNGAPFQVQHRTGGTYFVWRKMTPRLLPVQIDAREMLPRLEALAPPEEEARPPA